MKILIGTAEIAGWMHHFKEGFESLGNIVTTVVFEKSSFYDYQYDYELNKLFFRKLDIRKLKQYQYFSRLKRKINNNRINSDYKKFLFKLIDEHDVLLVFWHPFLEGSEELSYARSKSKKIISVFVGSDARYFRAFKQQYDISRWTFPNDWEHTNPFFHLSLIRNAEKYSDTIYSLPDQAGLQLKPYYHIHVPIASKKFNFKLPNNKKLKVLHAPSIPFKKGSDIIETTLEKLMQERLSFELISIRNMPNSEVLNLLQEADVLVDEIVYHGPGSLSFEAMLSGCAVATKYLEDSPVVFRPPVWPINAANIYEKLKILLTSPDLIVQLAKQGREYTLKNNESSVIVTQMIADLQIGRSYDYQPKFLRDHYITRDDQETQVINLWTNFVRDCDWYKKYILPGERNGLIF